MVDVVLTIITMTAQPPACLERTWRTSGGPHRDRSGDLAFWDEHGNITISGRIKDVINRGGIKYNPLDIELLIDRHPAVAQSAIVPMPDPVLGERACCFAVLAEGASLTLEEICGYLLAHDVAKIKLPERLEVVKEMPLTPTRKVIKGRLKISEA